MNFFGFETFDLGTFTFEIFFNFKRCLIFVFNIFFIFDISLVFHFQYLFHYQNLFCFLLNDLLWLRNHLSNLIHFRCKLFFLIIRLFISSWFIYFAGVCYCFFPCRKILFDYNATFVNFAIFRCEGGILAGNFLATLI